MLLFCISPASSYMLSSPHVLQPLWPPFSPWWALSSLLPQGLGPCCPFRWACSPQAFSQVTPVQVTESHLEKASTGPQTARLPSHGSTYDSFITLVITVIFTNFFFDSLMTACLSYWTLSPLQSGTMPVFAQPCVTAPHVLPGGEQRVSKEQ